MSEPQPPAGTRGAPPADQAARDTVATDLARTLFLEAGAGTGKTTSLVGRVVELVRRGTPMRSIAAITFTEAAATELRDRIRHALERAARAGEIPAEAAVEVDEAAISTLHAFAQRILGEHLLEAGLPPRIEVLDEVQSVLAFEERWTKFVDELLDDPAMTPVLMRAFALDLYFPRLRELAVALADHRDRLTGAWPTPLPVRPLNVVPVIECLREAAEHSPSCTNDDDKLVVHLGRLAELADRLATADDELEVLHLLDNSGRFSCTNGTKGSWVVPVDEVRSYCQAAEDARQAVLRHARSEIAQHLLYAVRGFTLEAAAERQASGRLTFADLLVECRDLLRSRPDVRAAQRLRFSHLLIDEFQDTDPLQVELAALLAAEPDPAGVADVGGRSDSDADPDARAGAAHGGEGPDWRRLVVQPGHLFFVGDAQQSIYRFRRADVDLFCEVRETLADETLALVANFRSVPGIIEWVNGVFGTLLSDGSDDGVEVDAAASTGKVAFRPLVPTRPPLGDAVPVVLMGNAHEGSLSAIRELEAADIVDTIFRIVHQEMWPVSDSRNAEGVRPARLADIAILLPTRTSLPQLEAAFDDAQVPYRVESASLVWETQEVRDLVAVLVAIDDPSNEVALVAALRSPALGCTDADLLEYHQAGGRWNLRATCPATLADRHPVCRGLALLRGLHERRWWTTVAGMVDRVVRELRFIELAAARPRPRDHWRRLRFVVDQARAFQEAGGRTLHDFVAWAEQQSTDEARVREPVLPESDDDAVRILTVHGAKGLEFPITILTGLNRAGGGGFPTRVVWPDVEGRPPEIRLSSFVTPGYEALIETERDLDRYEQLRLLYVAATRARDHLIVSVHRSTKRSDASMLADVCADLPGLWRQLGPPLFRMASPPAGRPPIPDPSAITRRQRWWAEREELIGAQRAPAIAATAVAAAYAAPVVPPESGADVLPDASVGLVDVESSRAAVAATLAPDEPGGDGPAPARRRTGAATAVGRAVHATLQIVDLEGADLDDLARVEADAEGIPQAADDVVRLVRSALASSVVSDAAKARHWRELYVAAPVATSEAAEGAVTRDSVDGPAAGAPGGTGSVLVEGFIDLIFESDDGLVIVDYKTDRIDVGAIDRTVGRYRLQLAVYALAIEQVLGRPVARAVLVFAGAGVDGAPLEHTIGDLRPAMAEARRLLAELA